MRILVADDALDNRLIVEAYLESSSHVLTFVENGQAAVTAFRQASFDVVLMDVRMPLMDGLAATRAIREIERSEARPFTPVIALSADAAIADVSESRKAGCQSHLAKPIVRGSLLAALAMYARQPDEADSEESTLMNEVKALIPRYLAEREQDLAAIPGFLKTGNFDGIRTIGHNMKGSGLTFGLPEIGRIGLDMEAAATRCDRETILRCTEDARLLLTSDPKQSILVSDAFRSNDSEKAALLQGTLDLLILRTLILGARHGQGIARSIQQQSEEVFLVDHGSLYLALQRLENKGWVLGEWGTSENNRRARFYTLTDVGRKQLIQKTNEWQRVAKAISRILAGEGDV